MTLKKTFFRLPLARVNWGRESAQLAAQREPPVFTDPTDLGAGDSKKNIRIKKESGVGFFFSSTTLKKFKV